MRNPNIDIGEDKDDICFSWHFGPQGHPASIVVTIGIFEETQMVPVMWVFSSSGAGNDFNEEFKSVRHLEEVLEYGKLIDAEFGNDPFWHRCDDENATEYHHQCEGCKILREKENVRAQLWFLKNPIPVAEQ